MIPPTRYTQSHGADVAFKVVGDGPLDVLLAMPFVSHLDMLWEDADWVNVFGQLTQWGRVISFGICGAGVLPVDQCEADVAVPKHVAGVDVAVHEHRRGRGSVYCSDAFVGQLQQGRGAGGF